MSGRKQHYIPQRLLRSFGFDGGSKKQRVQVYHRDGRTFTPPTDGIAAEREFYSELQTERAVGSLDDQITNYEGTFSTVLDELQALSDGSNAPSTKSAEIVTHLVVRGGHFRSYMGALYGHMVDEVRDVMLDPSEFFRRSGLSSERPTGVVQEEIDKLFAQFGDELRSHGLSRESLFELVKQRFPALYSPMIAPMTELFEKVGTQGATVSADAHRRALTKSIIPPLRVATLERFHWTVEGFESLILGDCVVIGSGDDGCWLPLAALDIDAVRTIVFPIGPRKALVGRAGAPTKICSDLNVQIANSSWDFFISNVSSDVNRELQKQIRSSIEPHARAIVDEAAAEWARSP